MRSGLIICCALVSVAAFAYVLGTNNALEDVDISAARRLQAAVETGHQRKALHWGPKHTAALVLSVLVSLTSSLDRECGASLYVVLFAVLLNMSFRKAAAMTAFTVALGALAPGIASMSEARLTERGVLPLVDYPGALVLLPTMFWGISFGAIVNLWFPNWLLAFIWVVAMLGSNIELLLSFVKYLKVKREANSISRQLRLVSPLTSNGGDAAPAAPGSCAPEPAMSGRERVHQRGQLLTRGQLLAKRAHKIEARALLYPTLYVPDVGRALQKAKVEVKPCSLRASATPSCLGAMDFEQERLDSELKSYQQIFDRFTFSWGKWWQLNRYHFEMSLVLKIVVLHLVTEAIRHHLSKPCTVRFWFMLVVMTGLVTAFLMFTVTSYSMKRLWRGSHWVDALNQVRQIKKQQQEQELQELQTLAPKDSAPTSPAMSLRGQGSSPGAAIKGSASLSAASAAVAAGDAVAVNLRSSSSPHGSDDASAMVPEAAAAAAADKQGQQEQTEGEQEEVQPGCWLRCKKRLPWFWGPATDAITNISFCNSNNQYKAWRVRRITLCSLIALPIGIFGCALGLPGGPMMAQLLLLLGIKPEVVAGTSRFLVLCFTFGSFVAHVISGGLEPQLAAAFGLLNLGLAPLGMFLITKVQPRGVVVIGLSLFMGVAGLVIVTVWQLVPLMAALVAMYNGGKVELPGRIGHGQGIAASLLASGNTFELDRFCHRTHH